MVVHLFLNNNKDLDFLPINSIKNGGVTQAVLAREKKKQSEQQRKEDTRRKILLGSYLLKKMENEANKEKILADLKEYLTEERDRKLFNL